MTLAYPTLAEIKATPKWKDALLSDLFGFSSISERTICTEAEMRQTLTDVRGWTSRSKTGQTILRAVDTTDRIIHVIGMKSGGYTCFDNDCPVVGEGTAYVDVEANYFVDGGKPLHRFIVILHELGHAKQWLENPAWFNQAAQKDPVVPLKDIQNAAIKRRIPKKVINSAPTDFANGPPPMPPPGLSQTAQTNAAKKELGLDGFLNPQKVWPFVIEQDNMARHELPVCRETKYPERPGYAHIRVTYNATRP